MTSDTSQSLSVAESCTEEGPIAQPAEEKAVGTDERRALLAPLPSHLGRYPRPRQAQPGSVAVPVVWFLAIAMIAVGTVAGYWANLRHDQYQLIQLGQSVYDGGRVYLDCWENKPPGIAWINALGIAMALGDQIGAWVLPAEVAVLSLALLYVAARRRLGRLSACGAILIAAGVYGMRFYDSPSVHPECYSSLLELAAFSLFILAATSERRRSGILIGLAAGLLWGAAVGVRQTGGVGLLAVTAACLPMVLWRNASTGRWLRSVATAWLGCAAGLGAVVGVLARQGTLSLASEAVFGFNQQQYLSMGAILNSLTSEAQPWTTLAPLSLALWLGVLGIVGLWLETRGKNDTLPLTITLLLWWLAQGLLARLGPNATAARYWQASFPPMIWAAALGIQYLHVAALRLPREYRFGVLFPFATAAVLLAGSFVDVYRLGLAQVHLASMESPTERERLQDMGRRIAAISPPGDPIFVWSYDTGLYLYAHRKPACRLTYPRSELQIREILACLWSRRPPVLLVPDSPVDIFDKCDGGDWRPRLASLLMLYDRADNIGNYTVYRLRPAPASQASR